MTDLPHHRRISPVHVATGVYWALLSLATVANIWWGSGLPWWVDVVNIAAFLVAEGWAIRHRQDVTWEGRVVALRDTLSEFMTWAARMAKPGARWYQSWNAMVALMAGHWAALPARQVHWATLDLQVIEFDPAQLAVWAVATGWLLWHWLRPDTKG